MINLNLTKINIVGPGRKKVFLIHFFYSPIISLRYTSYCLGTEFHIFIFQFTWKLELLIILHIISRHVFPNTENEKLLLLAIITAFLMF